MLKISENARSAVKLVSTVSVNTMLGGFVAAVMPPSISAAYKAATWIGGAIVSAYLGSKVEPFIDEQFDEVEKAIEVIDGYVKTIKETEKDNHPEELEEG